MTESRRHHKAKVRVFTLLALNPEIKNAGMEVNTGIYVPTSRGPQPYTADVLAERQDRTKFAVEVDGKVGHHGHIAHKKNLMRDRMLLEHGIITVRIATSDLVGRKQSTDAQVLEEIAWKLKQAVPLVVKA